MAKRIGRYEIYEKIGSGAFGEVYRAHDPEVNRPVAVKILSALSDLDNLARFRREAAAAGNLHHPNIVTIYDSGENEGVPFIVMELVEGRDLQKVVGSRKLSLLEKVEIMDQVAGGLHYAHENRVVHRDIKPANIMVLPDGSVKILDFGIARFNQPQSERQTRAGYLVGTILYMSPEQFQDGTVDSLCDIWAYGVVYYELLTGKYPFDAKDNAGLMYKVTRMDPPRIGSVASDIPDALEQIVHRALARDRELRYQSLYDLQLDTIPVLMDLRRQHATGLYGDARSLFDAGQLDDALAMVRKVLDLDPGKIEARQLRDQITSQMQRSKVRPRVDALVKNAEQEIGERRFGEAIESLESAARLDQADSAIRARLDEARRLAEMSARSSELVGQAEREFRLQEFGIALRLCAEALRLDPSYPQAQRLMDAIQQEMARRERKRCLEEALEKARGLLLIQAFDEVFTVLDSLRAEFPADPQVDQLSAIAKARQIEREKRNRLNEEMQAAKQLLKERRFADAVERLQRLRGDFSSDQQFTELLTFAEDELRRQMKDQEIGDLVEQARQLLAANRFDEALKLIDRGLQKYASDGTLIRQFQTAMAAKTAFEKNKAIEEAVERGEQLRQQGRPGEALNLIESAVSRYGAEPSLLRFRRELEEERQRLERAEALQKTLRQGEELLRQRNIVAAMNLVQAAITKFPEDTALQSLLARVTEANRQAEQRRFIDEQLSRALQLEKAEQWDAALAVVEDAMQHCPGSADLAVAQARVEKKRDEAQARKQLASYKLQVGQAIAVRDWNRAASLLEEARTRIPASDLAELRQQMEAARNRADLDALVAEAQDELARGDPQRARELIDAGLNQYGRQERLLRLRQILDREASYRENIAAAKRSLAEKRFGPANEFLQKALEAKPADKDALTLLDAIVAERAAAERAEALAAGKIKLERLLVERQFDRAAEIVESLLAWAPDDAELRQRLAEILRTKTDAEREAQAARKRAEQERAEQEARQRAEREARARAEREAIAQRERERAEREARLQAEREAQAQAQREAAAKSERERVEREGRLQAEREAQAQAQREAAAKREKEREAQAKAEREAAAQREKERAEREAKQRAEQEIVSKVGEIDSLLRVNDLDRATRVLELSKLKHGDDPRLQAVGQQLTVAAAEKQRRDEIQRLGDDARERMRQGQFDEAIRLLGSAAVRFPGVAEFPRLQAEAEAGRQRAKKQKAIQQALDAAAAMVEKGQAEAALHSLEDNLQIYPDSRELAEAAARLRGRVQTETRQRDIGESTQNIERKIAEGKFGDAAREAESSQLQYPNLPEFAALKRRAEAGQRQVDIKAVIESVARARHDNNLTLAAELVAAGRARFPDSRRLDKLFFEIEGARADENIARAKPLITAGKYDEAETLLHEALARRPKMLAAEELLRDIAGRRANRLRDQRMRDQAAAQTAGGGNSKNRGLFAGIGAIVLLGAGGVAYWKIRPTEKPLPPPEIKETWEHPTAVRGQPYAGTVHVGGGSPPLTWSVTKGVLPSGVSLSSRTGLIEGTPTAEGLYTFAVEVSDHEERTSQRAFTITVNAPPPHSATLVIANAGEPWKATRGSPFTEYLRSAGGTPPIAWSLKRSLPGGLALDPKTGHVRGTPTSDGVFTFTAKATDHQGHFAEGIFTIIVAKIEVPPPPGGPVISDGGVPGTATRGVSYQGMLSTTRGTPPISWSIASGALPKGLGLDPASGRIEGTPAVEGPFSFVVRATDRARQSAEHAFTINVIGPKAVVTPTPAPTPTPVATPTPPPCVLKPFDMNQYFDDRSGTVTWTGTLPANGDVTINRRQASTGNVSGSLPPEGVPFKVTSVSGGSVKDQPSAGTCWRSRVVLHNDSNTTVRSITINWTVFQP